MTRLGGSSEYATKVERTYGEGLDIRSFSGMSRYDVGQLYRTADLLLFPSWHEGFGMPVVEAMACGVPVVTSIRASLPQITGGYASLVEPEDVGGMAEAMEKILNKEANCKHTTTKAYEHARRYGWEKIAQQTVGAYREFL